MSAPSRTINVNGRMFGEHCVQLLTSRGLSKKSASIVYNLLLESTINGKGSHGLSMLPKYLRALDGGGVSKHEELHVVTDFGALCKTDGRNMLGHLSSSQAVQLAIRRARRVGASVISVKNASHFGSAGLWARKIASQGYIGIVMSNTVPAITAASFASIPLVGTNPIALSAPSIEGPVVADSAMSEGNLATVFSSRSNGGVLPKGWAVNSKGIPTCDPEEALRGALLSIGDKKGLALAFLIGGLTEVLAGSAASNAPSSFTELPSRPANCSHLFIAIDTANDSEQSVRFVDRMNVYSQAVLRRSRRSLARGTGVEFRIPGLRRASEDVSLDQFELDVGLLEALEWPD